MHVEVLARFRTTPNITGNERAFLFRVSGFPHGDEAILHDRGDDGWWAMRIRAQQSLDWRGPYQTQDAAVEAIRAVYPPEAWKS